MPHSDKSHEPVVLMGALVRPYGPGLEKLARVPLVNSLPRQTIVAHFDHQRHKEVRIARMGHETVPAQADPPRFEVELDKRVWFIR